MIDALQDGPNNSLLGLIAGSMPAEEAKPSWLQHPMRHLQKKIASGDTEEGAYPAEPRGMLNSPILADSAQTNSPTDGGTPAIRQVASNTPQAAPQGVFGSLAPAQSAPARPVAVPEAPAGIPAAVRRNLTPAPPASSQVSSTITVHAPDGSIVVFPVGTSAATINESMVKRFGGGAGADNGAARSRPLTLNIEGRKVNVDDSFSRLSPEDQDKTVDEIHASLSKGSAVANQADRSGPNTINVQGPDGSNFIFPAGTPTGEIRSALENHYGAKQSRAGSEWDAFPAVSRSRSDLPPLPPGYTMDAIPPLPPGYHLDAPPSEWDAFPVAPPITTNNVVRSAASGVPMIGGVLNRANAATNAALAPILNPLFDKKDQLSEPTFGERYAHSLRDQEGMDKNFEAAHPIVDTAAKLAGGVGSGVALLKAAPVVGSRVLGLTGKTLPLQIRNGALSGAAIGGADAAIRGDDWKTGALTGGGAGAAAPAAGHGAGKGTAAGKNRGRPTPALPPHPSQSSHTAIPHPPPPPPPN